MQNVFLMHEVLMSTPTDLLYEKHVFEHYLQILTHTDKKINDVTTLEEDLALLKTDQLSYRMRMSVTYRAE